MYLRMLSEKNDQQKNYNINYIKMKKLITIIATGIFFSSCQKNNNGSFKDELTIEGKIVIPQETNTLARNEEVEYNTFYGPVVQMGEGHVRSWANISHDNIALAIGIEMTEGALQLHDHDGDENSLEFLIQLHQKAKALMPFDHIVVNWNEHGHPPPGIYSAPHFDFHFYKMSLEQRLLIPAYAAAPGPFNNLPPTGYIPSGYFRGPNEGVPRMGSHWIDLLSPEFQGQPFTHTFIYGSNDGKVTFVEPMVTLATIKSGATIQKQIRQPQFFDPVDKYYPTRYNIWKNEDNNRHYIAMDQMVLR